MSAPATVAVCEQVADELGRQLSAMLDDYPTARYELTVERDGAVVVRLEADAYRGELRARVHRIKLEAVDLKVGRP